MKFHQDFQNPFSNSFKNPFRNTYHRPIDIDTGDSNNEPVQLTSRAKVASHEEATEIPHERSAENFPRRRSPLNGWRKGAIFALSFAIACLVVNVTIAVWIAHNASKRLGLLQLFRGSCSKAQKDDIWVHFAINIISTLLFGGSNFCMQCLMAPTRLEVDRAHQEGKWLDIGVPSLRNLRTTTKTRLLVWLVLGISSLPLHLMFNSTMYTSISTNDYDILITSPDFLTNASFTLPTDVQNNAGGSATLINVQELQEHAQHWDKLSNRECIQAYARDIMNDRRNLVVVSSNSSSNGSLLFAQSYLFSSAVVLSQRWYNPYAWICSDPQFASKVGIDPLTIQNGYDDTCEPYISQLLDISDTWSPFGYDAEYCLSEKVPELCSFNANLPVIIVVCVCNLIKVLAMLYVVLFISGDPLIVVGDAIQSFLQCPDLTTRNLCLLSKRHVTQQHPRRWPAPSSRSKENHLKASNYRSHWASAASWTRWLLTSGLLLCSTGIVLAFLLMGVVSSRLSSTQSLKSLGFGKVNAQTLIYGTGFASSKIANPGNRVISAILIANIPQLILSLLYLNINGVLTSMFLADEWSDFAKQRKHLRVSTPKEHQRSTYFLQLPYKVVIPSMMIAGIMHWLLSQSIFLAVVSEWNADGNLTNPLQIVTCGFSLLPMIIVLVTTVLAAISVIGLGVRKYNPFMPVVGSCSVAISAACHPVQFDLDAGTKALKWGAVANPDEINRIGHCCFSSGYVDMPQDGKPYA